ncbi:ankyrin-2 [Apiospora aurea]|uniref:Ankyrin-2 n=1 Tax=Apiospora aurea TaxID=335848 RepID=A0ABR1QIB1_9PEZI
MRGWLFGVLLWNHHLAQQQIQIQIQASNGHHNASTTTTTPNVDLATESFDLEVHAVAALLHDLGWDRTPNSPYVSPDRRFEVDSAIASRAFLSEHHQHNHTHSAWDHRRTQLVWDAIALHTTASISQHKEAEVRVVGQGIMMDFYGPQLG